jgi:thiamine transport system ATP-binding protein
MSFLRVDQLRIVRDNTPVIIDASFSVDHGTTTVIVGASGSGKSTLLAGIAGLISIDHGVIRLNDRDLANVPTAQRKIGLVFQDNQLFPHLSVEGNISYGLRRQRGHRFNHADRLEELLSLVDLSGFGPRSVRDLSGGEAKRVALARALAPEPELLLLDEPLTGLDDSLHDRLLHDLINVLSASNTTAIWVTHHRKEASFAGNRILNIHNGELTPFQSGRRNWEVRVISASDTFELRRAVLRSDTITNDVNFDGDDSAVHLAAQDPDNGEIVAISSWFQRSRSQQSFSGLQLRGMASRPEHRGTGAAQALLVAGIDLGRTLQVDEIWARARDTALGFYVKHQFVSEEPGYVDDHTGLPHHTVVLRLR